VKEVNLFNMTKSSYIRKDVECTFGILKKRFRILKNGVPYSRAVTNAIVRTCAILHNMLLVYDGLDEYKWNKNVDWEAENPEMIDEDIHFHVVSGVEENIIPSDERFAVCINDTTQPGQMFSAKNRNHHSSIRCALVEHFYHQWRYNQLEWPRRFTVECMNAHPMMRINNALAEHTYSSLYVKPTDLQRPGVALGMGLFCSMLLPSNPQGIKLAEFKGNIVSLEQYYEREIKGRGGYGILTATGSVLDCYAHAKAGMCKASMANSALNCIDVTSNKVAVNNCRIKVSGNTVTLYTAPNTTIPPNRELLFAYQKGYRYPI
jgi:hypothetical protein